MVKESERGLGEQMRADALSSQIASNMQVIEKGSPFRVVVKDDVSEADHCITSFGDHGVLV